MILPLTVSLIAPVLAGDDDTDKRLSALEDGFEAIAADFENFTLSDIVPPVGEGSHTLGPAASKVYGQSDGSLSIGGYGEAVYTNPDGGDPATFDMLRTVFYFGYKFNENWVFNSEIELEHADESFVEFAYIDYLGCENVNFRGGLMLTPMGLINEYHEPTTFLGAARPHTEGYIIPTTWREGGVSIYGEVGDFDYQVAIMGGLDGSGFGGQSGLRGGRQKGSKALAEDLAFVASLDYTGTNGLIVGASIYEGDSGQGQAGGDMTTSIVEAHVDYKNGPWWGRALVADAAVDDRVAGDMDLSGWYAELGYDVFANDDSKALYPYLRLEDIDTDITAGGIEDTATTIGLHYRPIDQIVIKADVTTYDDEMLADRLMITLGWVF